MLQKIGDALKGAEGSARRRWITYIVVGILSFVFAAWGAYGIVNLNFGGSNYAAEANGSKVTLEEARNAWLRQQSLWQQQLGASEIPPELRTRLQDQVLEGLIRNTLMTERSRDLGYRVSHDALREAIQSEPAFQIDGHYSAEVAKAALAQAGISLDAYQQQLSTQVQRSQLEGGIRASDFLTPVEQQRLTALEDEEREVRYLVLPADQFKAAAKLDDATIEAYYKAHEADFMTPESVDLQYAELRLESLAAQQTLSDADLRAAYEKQRSRLELPEKRHARHILITGKDDAAALAQAQQVLAQAKAGKDFGELAKQYSQDPGSAKNGGDLGWADRNSFVKPFADALFSMKVGEISGPIKTQFGYHIIRLDEIQAGKTKSFEEARPELEAQLRRDRATDRFGEIQEKLQSQLAEGAELGALAQKYNLQQGEVHEFAKGAGGAPLGAAPQLQELLFGDPPLAVGKVGGPVVLGDDRLVLVKVTAHRKPRAKPLAEVRDSIVAALTREQSTQAALKAAQDAQRQLAGGATFDSVARELKVSADPAHFIGRRDPSIPAPVREAAFALPKPAGKAEYRALPMNDGGAALVAVSATRVAAAHDAQAQTDRGLQEAQQLGTDGVLAYIQEVRRTADVRKNPKAFE